MEHRILIPFELPEGTPISATLADNLADMGIVALGHFGLPEQTPPEVASDQFGADAEAELDRLIRPLTDRGADVTTRVVFGRARDRTIDRVAAEEDCDVVFVPGEIDLAAIERVFVPVRGDSNIGGLLSFAAELAGDSDASVHVFHDAEEADRRPGEEILAEAVEELVANGLARDRIETELASADDVEADIVTRANEFDAVVLGETEPSLTEKLLGRRPAKITLDTTRPAFVVGNPERQT